MDNGRLLDDLFYEGTTLYRTPKGAYFVCGGAGPTTEYAKWVSTSTKTVGRDLWPVDEDGPANGSGPTAGTRPSSTCSAGGWRTRDGYAIRREPGRQGRR